MNTKKIGIHILRFALAFVFLWFGLSQISDMTTWVSFVPAGIATMVNPSLLVFLNGLFEILAGLFLAFGVLVRPVSFLLGLHLFFIALSLGMTAVGVRDIGLALATISFSLLFRKEDMGFFSHTLEIEEKT